MTIARALLLFALLATLAASVPKISEEDYAGMDPAFATYTLAVQAECDAKAWPAALAEELEDFCV